MDFAKKEMHIFSAGRSIMVNLICRSQKEKYGVDPERKSNGYGTNGVFRNPVTGKWIGLLMYNKKRNLIGDSNEKVEYLNLNFKQDADKYQLEGIYYPYKKKNKHWIAVIMDDSLTDQQIMDLIEISYQKSGG